MKVNPYQSFPAAHPTTDETLAEEERPLPSSITALRERRKRWGIRCYLISGALILAAIVVRLLFWSFAFQAGGLGAKILSGLSLLFFVGGLLVFVFGPISWFWTGQHKKLAIGDDDDWA